MKLSTKSQQPPIINSAHVVRGLVALQDSVPQDQVPSQRALHCPLQFVTAHVHNFCGEEKKTGGETEAMEQIRRAAQSGSLSIAGLGWDPALPVL